MSIYVIRPEPRRVMTEEEFVHVQDWLCYVFMEEDIPGGGIFHSKEGFVEFRSPPDYVDKIKENLQTYATQMKTDYTMTKKPTLIKACTVVLRPGGVPAKIEPDHFLRKIISKNKLPGNAYCPREFYDDITDRYGQPAVSRRFSFIPDKEMMYVLIGLQKEGQPLFYAATYADIIFKRVERPSNLPIEV